MRISKRLLGVDRLRLWDVGLRRRGTIRSAELVAQAAAHFVDADAAVVARTDIAVGGVFEHLAAIDVAVAVADIELDPVGRQ